MRSSWRFCSFARNVRVHSDLTKGKKMHHQIIYLLNTCPWIIPFARVEICPWVLWMKSLFLWTQLCTLISFWAHVLEKLDITVCKWQDKNYEKYHIIIKKTFDRIADKKWTKKMMNNWKWCPVWRMTSTHIKIKHSTIIFQNSWLVNWTKNELKLWTVQDLSASSLQMLHGSD